ncbi:MAG: hypothetical protein ACI8QC_003517 [Planctomycetota bacterium]|jgi:hypothetical protein
MKFDSLLLAFALIIPIAGAQSRYLVDDDAAPGGDGLTWATAFDNLDDAFGVSLVGDRVWVAEGTYYPSVRTDPAEPRSATFFIPQGIRVLGGFDGTETQFSQRAQHFFQTHLCGDLGVAGDAVDNSYHVVSIVNPFGPPPGATRLDGFRITDGNADSTLMDRFGGGVYVFNSAANITNCIIERNSAFRGGAVGVQPGILTMRWCTVRNNRAHLRGGGLWSQAASLFIFNSTFSENITAGDGGAIALPSNFNDPALTVVANVAFRKNQANRGGAVYLGGNSFTSGNATFNNCTFAFNRALTAGGGLRVVSGSLIPAHGRLHNCIVWGNDAPLGAGILGRVDATYCDLQDGTNGLFGNFTADPLFVSSVNLRLRPGSPCIDAAANNGVALDRADVDFDTDKNEPVPLDLGGHRRLQDNPNTMDTGVGTGSIVDVGAYED